MKEDHKNCDEGKEVTEHKSSGQEAVVVLLWSQWSPVTPTSHTQCAS